MADRHETVIVSAVRTPVGSFGGSLSSVPVTKLGSIVIREAVARAGIEVDKIDEAIMGNVLPAGVGQAPARQAALGAGLPTSVECMTINKVCGSGLKSVMLADQAIKLGDARIVVAGGMENMSQAPYLLPKARWGHRMGNGEVVDSMITDGLWDVYNDFHMGNAAELCAKEMAISREEQDIFAEMSYRRALSAMEEGRFKREIVPVSVPQRKGEPVLVEEDEEPRRVNFAKIPKLRPAFQKDGTVTAANASKINDGAAAVIAMAAETAKELQVKPLVRVVAQASFAQDPAWFTTAPAYAIQKVLKKAGMQLSDIDLFEINEAFAVVLLAVQKILDLDLEKVNVNGGAVAIGHPIGASGARLLTTLLYAMEQKDAQTGLVTLCIGGGEAAALIVERV